MTTAVHEENQTNPRIPLMTEEEANFAAPWPPWQWRKDGVMWMLEFVRMFSSTQLSFASFAAVQSLNSLNDQIAQFMVTRPCSLTDEDEAYIPGDGGTLRKSMTLMRHLLMDAQVPPATQWFFLSLCAGSSVQEEK